MFNLKDKDLKGKFVWHLPWRLHLIYSYEWSSTLLLQSAGISMYLAWCCPCNVLHGCLQCAAFALLRSHAQAYTHYAHMHAVGTNVICRLCVHCIFQYETLWRQMGRLFTNCLFLQVSRVCYQEPGIQTHTLSHRRTHIHIQMDICMK